MTEMTQEQPKAGQEPEGSKATGATDIQDAEKKKEKENIFSEDNLTKDSKVKTDAKPVEKKPLDLGDMKRDIAISPEDKASFIDAIVQNTRYTKDYSLFGGRVSLTVRSLTADEVNALSAWTVKQGTKDSAGLVAGRYRKYLLAAHVARLNGTDMPPLEQPLFETVGEDGKTVVPPGWIKRCDFFDGMGVGVFSAIMDCVADFDTRYSILCQKAEEANFWNPDTP